MKGKAISSVKSFKNLTIFIIPAQRYEIILNS